MSTGATLPLPLARSLGNDLLERIGRHVQRAELVGSIRRERPEVGDIEILAEPELVEDHDLFNPTEEPKLEELYGALSFQGTFEKKGERYVKLRLGAHVHDLDQSGIMVDLFLVHPPASWGVQKVIRTGPSDYSRLVVTRIRNRGLRVKRGAVWIPGTASSSVPTMEIEGETYYRAETPEEEDVFRMAKMEGSPPTERDEAIERFKSSRQEGTA